MLFYLRKISIEIIIKNVQYEINRNFYNKNVF